jgi:hypothetical protein
MEPRRFPPPWSVDELEACFVVKDSAGQKLAYVYCCASSMWLGFRDRYHR